MGPDTLERLANVMEGKLPLSPARIRCRQAYTLAAIIMQCDKMIDEALTQRLPAPGFLEIRSWASESILDLAAELP